MLDKVIKNVITYGAIGWFGSFIISKVLFLNMGLENPFGMALFVSQGCMLVGMTYGATKKEG